MKVIIFGGAGNVGSRIVNEALTRGHKVSVIVRSQDQLKKLPINVTGMVGDAQNFNDVVKLIKGQDLVVSALRPPDGDEGLLVALTETILDAAKEDNIRVLLVGGAASLKFGQQNETVLSAKGFLPDAVVPIAMACFAQHQAVESSGHQNWAYLSAPSMLVPGIRTGKYQLGKDQLLFDAQGKSAISMEDFAVALIDEIEVAKHRCERFTVAH